MKLGKLETAILCGITVLSSQMVWADTLAAPTSVSTDQSLMDVLSEKTALSYFGVYRGAPLNDLSNSLQPDTNGKLDPTTPQSIENLITTGYRFDKNNMLGVMTHFNYFPIGKPVGTGHNIQMLDPLITYQRTNIINSNGFKLSARLNYTVPLTSEFSKPRNLLGAITPTLITSYDVPSTKLTVGVFAYIRGFIPGADAPNDVRTYSIYVAPNANYQISQTVAATLWVDLIQANRNRGTGFFSGLDNFYVDIEPGISWDVTKYLTINPIINIYPSKPTLAATSLQAFIVARAF